MKRLNTDYAYKIIYFDDYSFFLGFAFFVSTHIIGFFFRRRVLQITDGIDKPGGIVWELALSLLVVWIIVYFSVWRGVHWTGKVCFEKIHYNRVYSFIF